MDKYYTKGTNLRLEIKSLVYDYMLNSVECCKGANGLTTAELFRACGLDWGTRQNATSSNQQYWILALLRDLESEGKIVRNSTTKRWNIA